MLRRNGREFTIQRHPHLGAGYIYSELSAAGIQVDLLPLKTDTDIGLVTNTYNLICVSAIDINSDLVAEQLDRHPELAGRVLVGGQGITPVATELADRYPDFAFYTGKAVYDMARVWDQFQSRGRINGLWTNPESTDLRRFGNHPSLDPRHTYRHLPSFAHSRIKPLHWSDGCTQACEFCPVSSESVSAKPTSVVMTELDQMDFDRFDMLLFVDHNLFNLPRDQLKKVFTELNRRGIKWAGEGTIAQVVNDDELLRLMAKNCTSFLAGLEDLDADYAGSPSKTQLVRNFDEYLGRLRAAGMPITWSMVFGLDSHTPETYVKTAHFIADHGIHVNLHLLQPRNGTPLQKQLTTQGRIRETDSRYRDGNHLVFEPANMSYDEALAGMMWLKGFVARTTARRFFQEAQRNPRGAVVLSTIELIAEGLDYAVMRRMYPELGPIIAWYEQQYRRN